MNFSLPLFVAGLSATAGGLVAASGVCEPGSSCQTAATCAQAPAAPGCCQPQSATAGGRIARATAATRATAPTVQTLAMPVPAPVAPQPPAAPMAPAALLQEPDRADSHWRETAERALDQARETLRGALRRSERSDDSGAWRAQVERALEELERVRTQQFSRVEREIERATREAQREIERAALEARRAGELARTRARASVPALGGLFGGAPEAGQRERDLEERVAELERRLALRGDIQATAPRDDRECTPSRARVLVAPRAQAQPSRFGYVIRVGPNGEVSTEGQGFEVLERGGWRAEVERAVEDAWDEARDAMDEVQELFEETFEEDEDPQTDEPNPVDGREVVFLAPELAVSEPSEVESALLLDLGTLGYVQPSGGADSVATDADGVGTAYAWTPLPTDATVAGADHLRALIADMQSEVAALRAELGALREDLADRRSRSSLR